MTTTTTIEEDDADGVLTRRITEALAAQRVADAQAEADAASKLEVDRGRTLKELGGEAQQRQAEAAAERNRAHEEQSIKYDRWLSLVAPEITRILEQVADLDVQIRAERERSAKAIAPLTQRKVELAREVAQLQDQPPAGFDPAPATVRDRIRTLIGRS